MRGLRLSDSKTAALWPLILQIKDSVPQAWLSSWQSTIS